MPLSDLQIRKAKQQDKPYRLSDGLGLFLQIQPTGTKLWQMRYQFMGKEKMLSIGQYPAISLSVARKKRDEAKVAIAAGTDPSVQKRLERIEAEHKHRTIFKLVAKEYYDSLVTRSWYQQPRERSVGTLTS